MIPEPHLIMGGLHRDARGAVRHVNGFDFKTIDRFYSIHPATTGEVRGWTGHQRNGKWFCVVQGVVEVGVVQPDDWTTPSRDLAIRRFMLSAEESAVLEVPPGYFTASIAHEPDSILLVFSSGRIEDAPSDDFRLAADHWALK